MAITVADLCNALAEWDRRGGPPIPPGWVALRDLAEPASDGSTGRGLAKALRKAGYEVRKFRVAGTNALHARLEDLARLLGVTDPGSVLGLDTQEP